MVCTLKGVGIGGALYVAGSVSKHFFFLFSLSKSCIFGFVSDVRTSGLSCKYSSRRSFKLLASGINLRAWFFCLHISVIALCIYFGEFDFCYFVFKNMFIIVFYSFLIYTTTTYPLC